jgi:hypothetical protein
VVDQYSRATRIVGGQIGHPGGDDLNRLLPANRLQRDTRLERRRVVTFGLFMDFVPPVMPGPNSTYTAVRKTDATSDSTAIVGGCTFNHLYVRRPSTDRNLRANASLLLAVIIILEICCNSSGTSVPAFSGRIRLSGCGYGAWMSAKRGNFDIRVWIERERLCHRYAVVYPVPW